jgi:hypothetical protein
MIRKQHAPPEPKAPAWNRPTVLGIMPAGIRPLWRPFILGKRTDRHETRGRNSKRGCCLQERPAVGCLLRQPPPKRGRIKVNIDWEPHESHWELLSPGT